MNIEELSAKTSNAYSFFRYGGTGWNGAIRLLKGMGLNDREVEAFMRSKHTRWAGDGDCKRTYGNYNGRTIASYIKRDPSAISKKTLDNLVEGTF